MNWSDIDPEKRDLSTPELWDAWGEEVCRLDSDHLLYPETGTAWVRSMDASSVEIVRMDIAGCQVSQHLHRPLEIGSGRQDEAEALATKLNDALARIEKLEAWVFR